MLTGVLLLAGCTTSPPTVDVAPSTTRRSSEEVTLRPGQTTTSRVAGDVADLPSVVAGPEEGSGYDRMETAAEGWRLCWTARRPVEYLLSVQMWSQMLAAPRLSHVVNDESVETYGTE
jgi:hypothetical protein